MAKQKTERLDCSIAFDADSLPAEALLGVIRKACDFSDQMGYPIRFSFESDAKLQVLWVHCSSAEARKRDTVEQFFVRRGLVPLIL